MFQVLILLLGGAYVFPYYNGAEIQVTRKQDVVRKQRTMAGNQYLAIRKQQLRQKIEKLQWLIENENNENKKNLYEQAELDFWHSLTANGLVYSTADLNSKDPNMRAKIHILKDEVDLMNPHGQVPEEDLHAYWTIL